MLVVLSMRRAKTKWVAVPAQLHFSQRERGETTTSVADHDVYIDAAPEAFRPVLARLRHLLSNALPEAEEMTAYNMPGFTINGTVVASYAAFSKQVGLYVLAPAIAENAEAIAEAGFKASKTGITFTPRKPIPEALVTALARASRAHALSEG